jgi:hypothetical protein
MTVRDDPHPHPTSIAGKDSSISLSEVEKADHPGFASRQARSSAMFLRPLHLCPYSTAEGRA